MPLEQWWVPVQVHELMTVNIFIISGNQPTNPMLPALGEVD